MCNYSNRDDIIVWPDGFWCFRYQLHEFNHLSDDYQVLKDDSEEHREFLEELSSQAR